MNFFSIDNDKQTNKKCLKNSIEFCHTCYVLIKKQHVFLFDFAKSKIEKKRKTIRMIEKRKKRTKNKNKNRKISMIVKRLSS